jgi:hypothetical protein
MIVVPRQFWLEISLWKSRRDRKKAKGARKKAREMVSKQPGSTAEIR